jgi:hypothetical protein
MDQGIPRNIIESEGVREHRTRVQVRRDKGVAGKDGIQEFFRKVVEGSTQITSLS